jgi:hypothetical protein
MIIIHNNTRITALAESYNGPDPFMPAPEGFEASRFEDYRLVDGEWLIPQPPVQEQIVTATQQRLDDFAKTRNYDGILSLATYATSTVPKFQTEGQYGVESRDATWAKLYEIMAEVEAGTRPMPTGYTDIEPELPPLVWPDEAPTA